MFFAGLGVGKRRHEEHRSGTSRGDDVVGRHPFETGDLLNERDCFVACISVDVAKGFHHGHHGGRGIAEGIFIAAYANWPLIVGGIVKFVLRPSNRSGGNHGEESRQAREAAREEIQWF